MYRFNIVFHPAIATSSLPTSRSLEADTITEALASHAESYPGAEVISATRINERGTTDWSSQKPLAKMDYSDSFTSQIH